MDGMVQAGKDLLLGTFSTIEPGTSLLGVGEYSGSRDDLLKGERKDLK